jgi:hypothetical protein
MRKLKQCAASRYCRVRTFVKLSAVSVIVAIVGIIVLFDVPQV